MRVFNVFSLYSKNKIMKKNKLFIPVLSSLIFTVFLFYSCSKSSDTVGPGTLYYPTFNPVVGSIYTFTNDSLPAGGGSIRMNTISTSTILNQGTYFDSTEVFRSTMVDRNGGQIIDNDTNYTKFINNEGKIYAYGFTSDLSSSQSPKWDLIADFSLPRNTAWLIDTLNAVMTLPQGNLTMIGPMTSKVADSTSIQTTGSPSQTIQCYRIEGSAVLQGTIVISSITYTLTATLIWDFYIAFSSSQFPGNPSWVVRMTLRPISITSNPSLISETLPGQDRILQTFTTP